MRRVAITGLGVIASTGIGLDNFFERLIAGCSGTRRIQNFDASRLNCHIAAEVPGYDPTGWFNEKELDQLDRFSQFAIIATREAWTDAGLESFGEEEQQRVGVCIGTAYGGAETLDQNYFSLYAQGANRLPPLVIPRLMYNAASCQVSKYMQVQGPCLTPTTACSSGAHAIGEAARLIQHGLADCMIAGGADAPITYGVIRCWEATRVLALGIGSPERACRPFSGDRQGIVVGEGAGIMILEEYERACKRRAKIYAELAGYGANSDASHITHPSVDGPARAMQLALKDAKLNPEEIDYVNAHGTATRVNDVVETRALKQVFRSHACALAISSTKSMHGHVMGASGAIELVATVEAMRRAVLPPTANYSKPDPECDLDYLPNRAREKPIRVALSNSFAFGGMNAVLVIKRI